MKKMLYKSNGEVNVWGMMLQTIIVNADEVEKYLFDGWHLNPNDTKILPDPEKKQKNIIEG